MPSSAGDGAAASLARFVKLGRCHGRWLSVRNKAVIDILYIIIYWHFVAIAYNTLLNFLILDSILLSSSSQLRLTAWGAKPYWCDQARLSTHPQFPQQEGVVCPSPTTTQPTEPFFDNQSLFIVDKMSSKKDMRREDLSESQLDPHGQAKAAAGENKFANLRGNDSRPLPAPR